MAHWSAMEWQKGNFLISDDQSRLDLDFIVTSLQTTYWASRRKADVIRNSIPNSLCFGVYECNSTGAETGARCAQVGFARVVTDGHTFSWICDVFIAPEARGQGLGTWLVDCVLAHPSVRLTNKLLGTHDAHGLYEKFGFVRREMMQKRN